MSAPYPWLEAAWRRLLVARTRPPQALLLAGPAGVGKGELALKWAQALLCEAPLAEGSACGACAACHWFETGTHPDLRLVGLQEKTTREGEIRTASAIEVDQAREVVDFVQLSTYRAGFRVVVIDPADSLNVAAASALLKVLEEPPLNTVFVLVSDQPRRLLPTIRSRCARVEVGLPPTDVAVRWLEAQGVGDAATMLALAGGRPLAAQRWADSDELEGRRAVLEALARPRTLDPATLGERWKALDAPGWHDMAYKWLTDLLAARLGSGIQFNRDFDGALTKLGRRADLGKLLALARVQTGEGRFLTHPLNRSLQLQAWLVEYRHVFD